MELNSQNECLDRAVKLLHMATVISTVMQTRDEVEGLHNCLEFSQRLSCLYQAMQTRKTFSIAYKTWTADCVPGLRTGYKTRTRYKRRTADRV